MARTTTDYERYVAAEEYHVKALKALEQVLLATFPDFPVSQREWPRFFEELRDARKGLQRSAAGEAQTTANRPSESSQKGMQW